MVIVEYSSNNSGGYWWLSDEDWFSLEKAGWKVAWVKDEKESIFRDNDRWLGALARKATKEVENPQDAIDEWAKITGQDPAAEGCNCCGPPHDFSYKDAEGKHHYTTVVVTKTEIRWD